MHYHIILWGAGDGTQKSRILGKCCTPSRISISGFILQIIFLSKFHLRPLPSMCPAPWLTPCAPFFLPAASPKLCLGKPMAR